MNYINKRVKITFTNHIRKGILHGEVKEQKDGYIYLEQFTEDKMLIPIQLKNIKEIIEL